MTNNERDPERQRVHVPRAEGNEARADLRRGAEFSPPALHAGPRGRRRRGHRHPARYGDDQPAGRPLRPAGDPRGVRQMAWTRPYGWPFDPLDRLAVVDYGDCAWDLGPSGNHPGRDRGARGCDPCDGRGDADDGRRSLHQLSAAEGARAAPWAAFPDPFRCPLGHLERCRRQPAASITGRCSITPRAKASSTRRASVQIGLRTHNDDLMGFNVLDAPWVHEHGAGGGVRGASHRRQPQGLPDFRHRLPGSRLCARNRDAGGGRAVVGAGARDPEGACRHRFRRHGHRRGRAGLRRGRHHRAGGRAPRPRMAGAVRRTPGRVGERPFSSPA